jgi:hypothetical protein
MDLESHAFLCRLLVMVVGYYIEGRADRVSVLRHGERST